MVGRAPAWRCNYQKAHYPEQDHYLSDLQFLYGSGAVISTSQVQCPGKMTSWLLTPPLHCKLESILRISIAMKLSSLLPVCQKRSSKSFLSKPRQTPKGQIHRPSEQLTDISWPAQGPPHWWNHSAHCCAWARSRDLNSSPGYTDQAPASLLPRDVSTHRTEGTRLSSVNSCHSHAE